MREITTISHVRHTHAQSGLATFMAGVYRYMMGGVVLSGLSAWACARQPILGFLYKLNYDGYIQPTFLMWIITFAPFIMLFVLHNAVRKENLSQAQIGFWVFSALMGASLSNIFLLMDIAVIFQALLITGAMFGALSLYGHTTQRDLSAMGRFAVMAVLGIIVAGLINIFTKSSAFAFLINIACVLAFAGLTAYDTQKLKVIYMSVNTDNKDAVSSYAIMGALALYLDFINLFIAIVQLLGNSRRR